MVFGLSAASTIIEFASKLVDSTEPWYYEQRISNYLDGYGFGKPDRYWFRVDRLVVRENTRFPYAVTKRLRGVGFKGYTEIHIRCEDTVLSADEWERVAELVKKRLHHDAENVKTGKISDTIRADLSANPDVAFDYTRGRGNEIAVFAIQSVDREVIRFILGWRIGKAAARIAGGTGTGDIADDLDGETR